MVLIGKIVAPHGIKGAVKVISYAESDDIFQTGSELWTRSAGGSLERVEIKQAIPHPRGIRMGFEKIANRTQAEAMVGLELYIDKTRLPELEEDTYYWFDLIGLCVKTIDDAFVGHIKEIIPTGGNDVYVVRRSDAEGVKECLIPAVADVIRRIDLDLGLMIVDLPEGL